MLIDQNYYGNVYKYNASGTLLSSFSLPGSPNAEDMATDSNGNLYFVDSLAIR